MPTNEIESAILSLRKAIANSDECKNVVAVTLFMNAYQTKISTSVATTAELKSRGISMRNIAGDFIVNDYGKPSFRFEKLLEPDVPDEHDETGAEW